MTSEVQSVVFNKRYWTESRAIEWLLSAGFKAGKVDITDTQIRFRQTSPAKYKRFTTKKIKPSVSLILGWKK